MRPENEKPADQSSPQPTEPKILIPNPADLAEWQWQRWVQNDNCDGEQDDPRDH